MEMKNTLAERAKLKCSVIGIGNAGNQLLNEVVKDGFEVFAINSSQADLDDSVVKSNIPSFIIGDEARGAGKNRRLAKNLLKVNGKDLIEIDIFNDMCTQSDVIIVAGSTAGGTGSGVAPEIIRLLQQMEGKIIIYCGILPRITDSPMAQSNSIECLDEIISLNVPYILADLEHYKEVPNDIAYDRIAKHLVDNINCICGKYLNKSTYGMIDENDMRTVISTPGYLSIYNLKDVTQHQLDKESMQKMMISRIKNSPSVEIMRDGIIKQMAAIINMPEEMSDIAKSGDYSELTEYIGNPVAVFENYANVQAATGQFVIILSGQTFPINRVSRMTEIVKTSAEKQSKQKTYNLADMVGTTLSADVPSFAGKKAPTKLSATGFFGD